jgi:hypothetical protein
MIFPEPYLKQFLNKLEGAIGTTKNDGILVDFFLRKMFGLKSSRVYNA